MAFDRVSRETAELISIPPTTWYIRNIEWLLKQEKVAEKIRNVPLNEPLYESVKEHGIKSPFLVMNNWYPVVGSQRLRACAELLDKRPSSRVLAQSVQVCRFDADWWNMFYLWSDKEFVNKAVAIWFQMVELAWKSQYYVEKADPSGVAMTEFERIGDELPWNHSRR